MADVLSTGSGRPFCPACDLNVNACTCELGQPDPPPHDRKWFVWAGRCGFGFRIRWIEVQVYWYGAKGDR